MPLQTLQHELLPLIESNLQSHLSTQDFSTSQVLKDMLSYHMGWKDDLGTGKRVRPFLMLLFAQALGGNLDSAIPGAIAIEFLHNFTLIHDDIEDQSPIRHGRDTLWRRWGIALAINAGDALFSISQLAILELARTCSPRIAYHASQRFNQVCLQLTQGQHLDIAFEQADTLDIDSYWVMIQGKTAALLAFSTELAGIIVGQDDESQNLLANYGRSLGMAFQILDDMLGIWGNPDITGKSSASDILTKKLTLPILFGLRECPGFHALWEENSLSSHQVDDMAELLKNCGAQEYAKSKAEEETQKAFKSLDTLFSKQHSRNVYIEAIQELSQKLLLRQF